MKFLKNKNVTIILAFISIILFLILFYWIDYLVKNNYYILEQFENINTDTNKNINNVDIPLTTKYSCTNFCGPTSRCAKTGQQCMADIDCPGCKPNIVGLKKEVDTPSVPGNNEAGKLTWGVTPQYSTLTTDIGTESAFFTDNISEPPPKATFGINTWGSSFNETSRMFHTRYTPTGLQFMPNYVDQITTTGEFTVNGPLPSNDYIILKQQ